MPNTTTWKYQNAVELLQLSFFTRIVKAQKPLADFLRKTPSHIFKSILKTPLSTKLRLDR